MGLNKLEKQTLDAVSNEMGNALTNLLWAMQEGTRQDRRMAIAKFEEENAKLPQVDIPLEHHFINKMYWRERPIKAGWAITTKIHREAGITVILYGSLLFMTEEGFTRIKGPAMFETHPGTKRVILVEEDALFSTIHPNFEDTRDVDALEARITAPDFSFLEVDA